MLLLGNDWAEAHHDIELWDSPKIVKGYFMPLPVGQR
jgi:hypothetical protein